MGLPALVTSWWRRSISLKAVCRPYWGGRLEIGWVAGAGGPTH